ncbi:hypothetical protein Ajs_3979 [Acidovorax sp. JS42]|jgi:ABC-type multidrug transport system fused ATPase/permease subunit|uniref:hypothetical protein n=1 Tax=Diaphorobacter sp. JS3051 TaxID=2792224 RepID=UPI0000DC948E|nr:hypothetical protein [Diaphorobacter sp. JS3051]ABM44085.1 hypothetical protein Ajs_3979 [Acidovorax sp. JS42]QPN32378.1 hypothetical protein I3K84_07205 [Diaphorobacter sp. JS3051]QPN32392.1 hypothetical protein I3K84_07280 [Diaphorobacter sp. JS3051]
MLKQLLDRAWSGGTSPHDSEIYALIHKELSSGGMDAGLWTKAIAVSDGNNEKAKSRYIEMRANALRKARKQVQDFAKQTQREQRAIERQNAEQERLRQELNSLKQREASIDSKLWREFTSPDAKKRKRKKQLRNTVVFIALSLGIYFLSTDEGLAIVAITFAFFFWILSLATYGKYELENELKSIRSRIVGLGGNA